MDRKKLFRGFLVAVVLLQACGSFVDAVFPSLVPEPLRRAQELMVGDTPVWQDYLLLAIGLPVLLGSIAAVAGLYFFRPWAPRLAVLATLGTFLLYFFVKAEVFSPVSAALVEAAAILWGVVLAMAFLLPLRAR